MKAALLISGGVDSSVALALLKEQGVSVTAYYLKVWLEDELDYAAQCPWEEDLRYVEETCNLLETPLQIVPMQQEYRQSVIRYTLEAASNGHTPNPDLLCNSRIKFGAFLDRLESLEPQLNKVATGHYAAIQKKGDHYQLLTSADKIKDQTYFLAHLDQRQLSRALFPLAGMNKRQVRAYAKKRDLPAQSRKDSQGLCFLGRFRFREFLAHYLGEKKGDLIEWESGKKLGDHPGFWFYTIGQRQGLGLSGGSWYVVHKDAIQNRIYISRDYHSEDCHSGNYRNEDYRGENYRSGNADQNFYRRRNSFYIQNPHWIAGRMPRNCESIRRPVKLQVKLRHGEQSYPCQLKELAPEYFLVTIAGEDQGIAPGQFAVFYSGEVCLGCAVIQGGPEPDCPSNKHGA